MEEGVAVLVVVVVDCFCLGGFEGGGREPARKMQISHECISAS